MRASAKISHSKLKTVLAILVMSTPLITSDHYVAPVVIPSKFLSSETFVTQSGKSAMLSFFNDHVQIKDSYQYNFDERMDILYQVKDYATEYDIDINRDMKKLESEWYIHNICYTLGIKPESTKDADLDFVSDARWFVNFATEIASIFYSQHKIFDSYQEQAR